MKMKIYYIQFYSCIQDRWMSEYITASSAKKVKEAIACIHPHASRMKVKIASDA